MRIVHYINSIDRSWGGTAAYLSLLATELGRRCELHIITHRSDNPLPIMNAQVHWLDCGFLGLGMKRQYMQYLEEIQPDLVHVNGCWLPCIALAQKWAQDRGYRVVYSPHGMLEPWIMARHYWTRKWPAIQLFQRRAIRNADMIHATAGSERDNLLKLGWNDRVTVIANGVDVEAIEMKKSWKRKNTILFLSRVHPKKGINFLIEAAAMMKDELAGYTINIAGESFGNYMQELKALAKEKGVEETFFFFGGVYGNEKWRLYREADLFVLPTHSENFGIVVAEALASGTPVITTKGTPWSDIEDYSCGWWTEIGVQPTVDALRQFIALTETELEAMGRKGRKLVEDKYSAKAVAGQMVDMYKDVMR